MGTCRPSVYPLDDQYLAVYHTRVKGIIPKTIDDIHTTIRDLIAKSGSTNTVTAALENTATELSTFVDPPIDLLSHQVQFIVVWNANATPNWTLAKFKGPGAGSGSLFSATDTKTHTLNIVLGPPGSLDTQSALAALQIGTALTNAVGTGAVTIVSH